MASPATVMMPLITCNILLNHREKNTQPTDILHYAHDGLGSVVALSGDSGNRDTRYHYGSFGELLAGDISRNEYTYTGQRLAPESKLYHFHFRQYDAGSGVWTAPDPIGILGGVNLYGYVANNSVNVTDILGLWWGGRDSDTTTESLDDTGPGDSEIENSIEKNYRGHYSEYNLARAERDRIRRRSDDSEASFLRGLRRASDFSVGFARTITFNTIDPLIGKGCEVVNSNAASYKIGVGAGWVWGTYVGGRVIAVIGTTTSTFL